MIPRELSTYTTQSPFILIITIAPKICYRICAGLAETVLHKMAHLVPQLCLAEEVCRSQMFHRLAEQLQLHRENEVEKNPCSIISDFGVIDSVSVQNDQSTSFNRRKRRAAVLICLFEGQDGELRVILTKRSMKLSSYPGKLTFSDIFMDFDTCWQLNTAMGMGRGLDSTGNRVEYVRNLMGHFYFHFC